MSATTTKDHLEPPVSDVCITVEDLRLSFGDSEILKGISMDIPSDQVTALIGPSGCGKSVLLRCFNRMNSSAERIHMSGHVRLNGIEIYDDAIDVAQLRRKVGMVFQKPNPFPMSIYDNVAYGLRLASKISRTEMDDRIRHALKSASLWDETRHKLNRPAVDLSAGEQQRLVLARALAVEPDVLLLDEPTANLDPISTLKLEESIDQLKSDYTIVVVTHNMQAARMSNYTGFLHLGRLVEYGTTDDIFTNPVERETEDYITGRLT